MPSLVEVCVWEDFSSSNITIATSGSPNICFQTDCNGDCSILGSKEFTAASYCISPNPTTFTFTLDLEAPIHGELEIQSLNGQLIYSRLITATSEQIDMSSYAKGIYFVTVRSDAWVRTEKVVKY